MKRIVALLLCGLVCLGALPGLARAEGLPVIRITYVSDAVLSLEEAVDAQVTLTANGQETVFAARLRLGDESRDSVETALPQKSLRLDGDGTRLILSNDGADAVYTKCLAAVCASLIAQGPIAVPVQAQEPVEVYLNGEYWGLYTRREVIQDAIARFEGLSDDAGLNVADAGCVAVCGDVSALRGALREAAALDLSGAEGQQRLSQLLDVESLLNWMAVNAYLGNANLYGTVFFYQAGEGPWKLATGDFAYALQKAGDDSVGRLAGSSNHSGLALAQLTAQVLGAAEYRAAFAEKLGALYQALPVSLMQETVDAENRRIADALPAHMQRWAAAFAQALDDENVYPAADAQEALLFQSYCIYRLRDKTLPQRPWYVQDSARRALALTDAEMASCFGQDQPALPEIPGDTWADYQAAHQ